MIAFHLPVLLAQAETVLNMMVCAFSEYAARPFSAEAVVVNYKDSKRITPVFSQIMKKQVWVVDMAAHDHQFWFI